MKMARRLKKPLAIFLCKKLEIIQKNAYNKFENKNRFGYSAVNTSFLLINYLNIGGVL